MFVISWRPSDPESDDNYIHHPVAVVDGDAVDKAFDFVQRLWLEDLGAYNKDVIEQGNPEAVVGPTKHIWVREEANPQAGWPKTTQWTTVLHEPFGQDVMIRQCKFEEVV